MIEPPSTLHQHVAQVAGLPSLRKSGLFARTSTSVNPDLTSIETAPLTTPRTYRETMRASARWSKNPNSLSSSWS